MGSDPAGIDLMHPAATGNQAPLDAKDPQSPEDPGLHGFLASLCALSAVLGSIGERELECSITLVRRDLEPLHAGSSARHRTWQLVFRQPAHAMDAGPA